MTGPEEYLFGEETGLLEVVEGNDPLPRELPPYLVGLFATTPPVGWSAGGVPVDETVPASNPTLVDERRDPGQRPADPGSGSVLVPVARHRANRRES